MANFYVTHHTFPSNPQFFTINLHKIMSLQGEVNPNFKPSYMQAERYWKVFIYTSGLDSSGDLVGPVVADVFGGNVEVNTFVESAIANLCGLIDWSQQGKFSPDIDTAAPFIAEQFPLPNQVDVPISAPIVLRVKDLLPGNGVDVSTVSMKVRGLVVSPTVTGNKFDSTFTFSPVPIYNS